MILLIWRQENLFRTGKILNVLKSYISVVLVETLISQDDITFFTTGK